MNFKYFTAQNVCETMINSTAFFILKLENDLQLEDFDFHYIHI